MSNKIRNYKLAPLAENDLENIWLYTYKKWSLEQADNYHQEIIAAFQGLANGLKIGRTVDIRDDYLKYAVGSHFIFYRQTNAEITVIRILHQRMDTESHL